LLYFFLIDSGLQINGLTITASFWSIWSGREKF